MIEAIKEVNEQILKVYYIPNSEGTVKLKIENFEELIEINKRLN